MISGGSSGGISSFVIAWFHPEYFHRAYLSSPSLLSMGRGYEIPYLVRKCETKPIKIVEDCSEIEPNDYFGWIRPIDEELREALIFTNYDLKYLYYPGETHNSRYFNEEEAYMRNEWLWKDWDSVPITVRANSTRVDKVIPFGKTWEPCDSFPEKVCDAAPELLKNIYEKVILSNDDMVWYAANKADDVIHLYPNDETLSPDRRILHATLHTIPHFNCKGAIDMAVDKTDRLFVLTDIGIQCVRSYGLIDVILDLPKGKNPTKIAITDALYVKTEDGIFKRELCDTCILETEEKRKYISYYD